MSVEDEPDVGNQLMDNPLQSYLEYPETAVPSTGFLSKLTSLTQDKSFTFRAAFPEPEQEPEQEPEHEEGEHSEDEQEQVKDKPFRFQHPSYNLEDGYMALPEDDRSEVTDRKRPRRVDWRVGLDHGEVLHKAEDIVDQLCVVKESVPWSDKLYEGKDLASLFQQEIDDFIEYMSPTEEEHRMRMYVVARIAKVVQSVWSDAQVKVFGSFDTKLYLPTSDMDIVVFCDQYGGSTAHHKLNRALKSAGLVHNGKSEVISARIPIIKFVDSIGQFPIDISFNIETGVMASSRLRQDMLTYPALRPLVIVLKQFLLMRGLNEVFSGGLGSFGLASTIISFLQLHPLIQTNQIEQELNLNVLLMEYLDLYGRRLAYDDVGIALHNGGLYFNKHKSSLSNTRPHALTMQDPEELSNDITRGTFRMRDITRSFARAYDILTGTFYELDERYVQSQGSLPQSQWGPYSVNSILATIVNVPESVRVHREYVVEKHNSIKELISELLDISEAQEPSQVTSTHKRKMSPDSEYIMEEDSEDDRHNLKLALEESLSNKSRRPSTMSNNSLFDKKSTRSSKSNEEIEQEVLQALTGAKPSLRKTLQTFSKATLGFIIFRNSELAKNLVYSNPSVSSEDYNVRLRQAWQKLKNKQRIMKRVQLFISLYNDYVFVDLVMVQDGGCNQGIVVYDNHFIDRQKMDLVAFIMYIIWNKLPMTSASALAYSAFKTTSNGMMYYNDAQREIHYAHCSTTPPKQGKGRRKSAVSDNQPSSSQTSSGKKKNETQRSKKKQKKM